MVRGLHGALDPRRKAGKSKTLPTRVPAALYDAIQHAAEEDERSMADYIRLVLMRDVRARGLYPDAVPRRSPIAKARERVSAPVPQPVMADEALALPGA